MVLQRGVQLFFLLSALLQLPASNGEVLVDLPNGRIQGLTQNTYSGVEYNSFYGVRYGRSPMEELRFQPPQPVEAWEDVFDATEKKGICFQVPGDFDLETEDCLFLNLYTPAVNASAGLPVMFFIHGGGFVEGSGILSWGVGPQFFMEYGVIMVAINYRIGPFGYLSTGDEVIPGNVGSKDQILALQWVKENIRFFGGDPDKVTVFGQSAGAASISYLLLSPLAEGLFRSGSFIRVPILIGFNAEESMFMLSSTFETTLKAYDENSRFLVPFDFHVEEQQMLSEIGHEIKEFYSPDRELEDNTLGGLQYHSTQDFDKAVLKQAELAAAFVPVYLYEFTYSGPMGNNQYKLEGSGAVRHGEEQNYIFNR
uniref:Carboxylic ester hydrolase n=1 Tax=Dendroctonus ponderosae TaxID=77166 RepID=A0AAR5PTD0_DENPD